MRDETFYEGANRITVDILDRDLSKVGPGPLATCLDLTCESLLNQAGTFEARFPANDPRLAYLQLKRHLLTFYVDGELVHAGIAESDRHEISDDGQRILVISGRDMLAELDETTLGFTPSIDEGIPSDQVPFRIVTDTYNDDNGYAVEEDIRAWHLDNEYEELFGLPGATEIAVYGKYAGETTLKALTRIAEYTGEAFRLALNRPIKNQFGEPPNPLRYVEWLGKRQRSSGVRAVQAAGDSVKAESNPHLCFIQRLTASRNASRLLTKIIPYGAGLGETRLDLLGTSRVAPSGFTLDENDNSISSDDAETYIGKALSRHINFKDVRPLFNTDADTEYAKDYLFDVALAYLQRNDDPDDSLEYELEVIALPNHVREGMTLHVIYQDENFDLDLDLMILGIRRNIDSAGASTFRLTVSHNNQWRLSESSAIVAQMEEGEIFAAHPQIDANTYWENFREEVGDSQTDHIAEFPFWLSAEVVTIRQVLFRYKVDRILTGTNTYAYDSVNTDGSSAANTGNATVTTDSTEILIDNATVTTDSTEILINNTTVTVNPLTGGNISSSEVTTTDSISPDQYTDSNYLGLASATQGALSSNPTNHSHDIGVHVHDMTHTHTTTTHSHVIDHGHSTAAHSHTNTAHLHTSDAHSHTNTAHLHTSTAHGHTMAHTHPMASLVATFDVMRVPALNSYVMADLEYSVNGGTWVSLDEGTPVAGGYYELDITSEIQNPNGLRRPLQEYNVVEIRRKSSAATGKTALIRAKLGIRSTIQSIVAYA